MARCPGMPGQPAARHAGAIRLGDQSGRLDPRKPVGDPDGLWRADAGAV